MYGGHVTLKVKLLPESLVAEVAWEGPLFVVHQPHVPVQLVLQWWRAMLYLYSVWQFLDTTFCKRSKLFSSHLYDKQFLGRSIWARTAPSSLAMLLSIFVRFLRKAPTWKVAISPELTIGPLLHVHTTHVDFKVHLLPKSLVAEVARVRSLFEMHWLHMFVQHGLQGCYSSRLILHLKNPCWMIVTRNADWNGDRRLWIVG